MTGHVQQLHGLRGLMSLWVVIGHWSTTINLPFGLSEHKLYNGYAVDVFIILSGFAIASAVMRKLEPWRFYIARRALRIFPAYLLFLFISVLLLPFAVEIWQAAPDALMKARRIEIAKDSLAFLPLHLPAHLLALHGLIPPTLLPSTDYAILGQAWSISLEWQFYLIAPFLIGALKTKPLWRFALFLTLSLCFRLVPDRLGMPAGFIGRSLHLFLIGIASCWMIQQNTRELRFLPIALLPIIYFDRSVTVPILIWCLTFAGSMGATSLLSRVTSVLNKPSMQRLGDISYSVYLSHMIAIVVGLGLLSGLQPYAALHATVLLFITLGLTLMLSILAYRFVEVPFKEFGNRSLRPATA